MQFVNNGAHYLNPRFSSELGFLNKPVFEMQQKIHAINKSMGTGEGYTDKQNLELYWEKIKAVSDFKKEMNKEVRKNCPELELQANYALDVQLTDQVCNEVGMWCEKQTPKDKAEAELKASAAMHDTRINWYREMFGKANTSLDKAVEKNNPEIDLDKD